MIGNVRVAEMLGLGAVGDRLGNRDMDDLARPEGALPVVAGLRLDPDHGRTGRQSFGAQGRAGQEAAAAEADQ